VGFSFACVVTKSCYGFQENTQIHQNYWWQQWDCWYCEVLEGTLLLWFHALLILFMSVLFNLFWIMCRVSWGRVCDLIPLQ
jgi:hypothetical protein